MTMTNNVENQRKIPLRPGKRELSALIWNEALLLTLLTGLDIQNPAQVVLARAAQHVPDKVQAPSHAQVY
jgi:hypothetical protein